MPEPEYINDDPRNPVLDVCQLAGCDELAESGDIYCKECQKVARIEADE